MKLAPVIWEVWDVLSFLTGLLGLLLIAVGLTLVWSAWGLVIVGVAMFLLALLVQPEREPKKAKP